MEATLRIARQHEEMLAAKPDSASHDRSLCPICIDWSMTDGGVPTCHERMDDNLRLRPYGDVVYADEGSLGDGVYRFPIDTEEHTRASKDALEKDGAAELYAAGELENLRSRTEHALQMFIQSRDLAEEDTEPNLNEGGEANSMDTITQETHEALLQKAVQDATESVAGDKARLTDEVSSLTEERDGLSERVTELEGENERLNTELDNAQVKLKDAQDEVESLKTEIVNRDDQAQKGEVASQRAEQVRNLNLFSEDYIKDNASRWADVDESEWDERVKEWQEVRTSEAPTTGPSDNASDMSGTSENDNNNNEPGSARRAVLGLA